MLQQQQLIQRFRIQFPELTFKQIAQRTGINATRLFRIFNGQEMKLSEYEVISSLIEKSNVEQQLFECQINLPDSQLERISSVLQRYLDSYMLTHDAHLYYKNQKERAS